MLFWECFCIFYFVDYCFVCVVIVIVVFVVIAILSLLAVIVVVVLIVAEIVTLEATVGGFGIAEYSFSRASV